MCLFVFYFMEPKATIMDVTGFSISNFMDILDKRVWHHVQKYISCVKIDPNICESYISRHPPGDLWNEK